MGFLDAEVSGGGGGKQAKFDGKAGNHVVRGSDDILNNKEAVFGIYDAQGGYLKFNGKGTPPERRLGSIFPKDEAPLRSSLGDTDKSEWPKAKFGGDEPEDPWVQVIEIPMRLKETGEPYVFSAQSKTSLAAIKDLLSQCRRMPEGFEPLVRLGVGSYKGKFGTVRKPVFSILGKVPMVGDGEVENDMNDAIPF
jgi:hypothetical protein